MTCITGVHHAKEVKDLKEYPISVTETVRAGSIVGHFLKPTQLIRYEGLSRDLEADVFVKHENHNPTGSFKIRGGVNLVHHLKQRNIGGVIKSDTSECKENHTHQTNSRTDPVPLA